MKCPWHFLFSLVIVLPGSSQTLTRQNVANILGFENNTQAGVYPVGWGGGPVETIVSDNQVVHSGNYSARFDRNSSSASTFSSLTAYIPIDFTGQTIQWCGWAKTSNVAGFVALWLREDGPAGPVQFASMQSTGPNVTGTTDWTQYCISLPWTGQASELYFGFLLDGTGTAWVDDLQLMVDGQPIAQAPNLYSAGTDHQFDNGSDISLTALSPIQITNLATLAKVWGFVKYHHPIVTAGQRQWDYDLFRVMPQVLAASDQPTADQAMSAWIAALGTVPQCTSCATLDTSDLKLNTNIGWISDQSLLGADLSQTLQNIYANRTPQASQYYVSLVADVGNPSFGNELYYPSLNLPDSGYQLLALFRLWNMVQYFYPDRDVMADDPANQPDYWDQVLAQFIPVIGLATDSLSYQQGLLQFIAQINDTHANLWSSLNARPPLGTCYLPVNVRFVQGKPVVVGYLSAAVGPDSGFLVGDIVQQLDGANVSDLIAQWTPYYADSNQAARLRDIAEYMTRGTCGAASVVVQRVGQTVPVSTSRLDPSTLNLAAMSTGDLPGDTFQLLSPDVAYLKLSSVVAADSASYVQSAAGTKGLIIDIRNYPSDFVVFTLGDLLISEPTEFVRFTQGDITNPSAFHWGPPLSLTPQQPHYGGKVVILVDELTQSQAEYTTMAFRAAPGAMVIGSTTAGADGNVSTVPLPGGLSSLFSGIGVFYPDDHATQRVGIIPNIKVAPTIAGILAGRDEVLDAAVRSITQPAHRPR